MLRGKEIAAFIECLYNTAPFEPLPVAKAIVLRTAGISPDTRTADLPRIANIRRVKADVNVQTHEDIYSVCSDEFLGILLEQAADITNWGAG